MNDAQAVTQYLREKTPVIINLEETAADEMERILDFISGSLYAVAGQYSQVGQKVFICAPKNIVLESSGNNKNFYKI